MTYEYFAKYKEVFNSIVDLANTDKIDQAIDICIENNFSAENLTKMNENNSFNSFNRTLELTILVSGLYEKRAYLSKHIIIDDLHYNISSVTNNLRNYQDLIECYVQLINPTIADSSDIWLEPNEGKEVAKKILKSSSFSNDFIDSLFDTTQSEKQ